MADASPRIACDLLNSEGTKKELRALEKFLKLESLLVRVSS